MRSVLLFISFVFLLQTFLLSSCKRKTYDPKSYDYLLYKEPVEVAPPKEYIFRATIKGEKIDSTQWVSTATALVSEDTLTITSTFNDNVFVLKLKKYNTADIFSIGSKKDTASLTIKKKGSSLSTKYVSRNKANGKINKVSFDSKFNQIEANFNMVLYSTTSTTSKPDSVIISNGYFKINFTPNDLNWIENGEKMRAQTVWATKGDFYEIHATDSINKRSITIIIPFDLGGNGYSPAKLGKTGSAIYYTDSQSNFIKVRAFEMGRNEPTITVYSISDNIIKGRFNNIHIGGDDPDSNYMYAIDGTFSAQY